MKNKKFNSIDVLVLFLIIIVGVGAIWYLTKADESDIVKVADKIQITFVADTENIDKDALQELKVGDSLISNSGILDAVITDIVIKDSEFVEAINGEFVMIKDAQYKNVRITMTGMINKYGPYLDLGGQAVKVGTSYKILTGTFEASGKVVQILD